MWHGVHAVLDGSSWTETILHTFGAINRTDGAQPEGSLLLSNGFLYGATLVEAFESGVQLRDLFKLASAAGHPRNVGGLQGQVSHRNPPPDESKIRFGLNPLSLRSVFAGAHANPAHVQYVGGLWTNPAHRLHPCRVYDRPYSSGAKDDDYPRSFTSTASPCRARSSAFRRQPTASLPKTSARQPCSTARPSSSSAASRSMWSASGEHPAGGAANFAIFQFRAAVRHPPALC